MIKASIIYYTRTGNTLAAAELVRKGLERAGDISVKLMSVEEIDQVWLVESAAVILGSPTYSASFAWPLKRWFDDEARYCGLGGKMAGNFATGRFIGGGADAALASMATHELVRAMLVYSGGGPLTHTGAVLIERGDEPQKKRMVEFGTRFGLKALELFASTEKAK